MSKHRTCVWGAVAIVASAPFAAGAAEFSPSWRVLSEWFDRGVSQTAGRPALQTDLEMTWATGWYAGFAGSNVHFGECCRERVQLDAIGGRRLEFDDWRLDAGATASWFPGARGDDDAAELFAGAGWHWLDLYGYWTDDYAALEESAWYFEARAAVPLGWQSLELQLAAGYHFGEAFESCYAPDTGLEPYGNWSVAVSRPMGPTQVTVGWTDTDIGGGFRVRDGPGANDGRIYAGVAWQFGE
jgi:uncharacterized protein (TIGR02001 family)